MLKHVTRWSAEHHSLPFSHLSLFSNFRPHINSSFFTATISPPSITLTIESQHGFALQCGARRRAIREDEDNDEEDECGFNEEIAVLETYTQWVKDEVLLVQAMVDEEDVEVIIFKGFSSCLSYQTSPDPTRSVLPARAVIKSIDRVRGPFDPSNIEYIEKGLHFDEFKNRLRRQ